MSGSVSPCQNHFARAAFLYVLHPPPTTKQRYQKIALLNRTHLSLSTVTCCVYVICTIDIHTSVFQVDIYQNDFYWFPTIPVLPQWTSHQPTRHFPRKTFIGFPQSPSYLNAYHTNPHIIFPTITPNGWCTHLTT